MHDPLFQVRNQPGAAPYAGRRFNVRLVFSGEKYGRDDCLTHDKREPLIEFYDAGVEDSVPKFGPRGQFVARYRLRDIIAIEAGRRLPLDVGVPVWALDETAVATVVAWLAARRTEALEAYEQATAECADALLELLREKDDGIECVVEAHEQAVIAAKESLAARAEAATLLLAFKPVPR